MKDILAFFKLLSELKMISVIKRSKSGLDKLSFLGNTNLKDLTDKLRYLPKLFETILICDFSLQRCN